MSEDNLTEEPAQVLFRPSYSATWLNCEAALLDGRFYPDSAGIEAAIGTVFHDIMNEWLVSGSKPYYRLGTVAEVWKQDANRETDKPFLVEIDEDMFYYGAQCVRYIRNFPGRRLVECRVDISHITPIPNQSGTLDVGFLSDSRAIIVDWKYGTGVKVFAEWNTQELLYLSGVFEEWDWLYGFEEFELHIAQPRLKHWDKFTLNRQQLLDWMEWAKERARASWNRKGRTYTVGTKQCTWCKRRDDCRAKLVALEALVDETIEVIEQPISPKKAQAVEVFTPPPSMETTILRLSPKELEGIYQYRKIFETWFRRIGERLLELGLENQDSLSDYYVTEGRSNRRWKSERELIEKVTLLGVPKPELYEPGSLKSPAQVEKLLRNYGLRGKALEEYMKLFVDRPPGKPTLVRRGEDERAALDDYSDVITDLET